MLQLAELLEQLSEERPIFHSEAVFQHALAWKLHETVPEAGIRLKYRPFPGERFYLDIWMANGDHQYAFELKYLTRLLDFKVRQERFQLKNQATQDISRHDVVQDIVRLERIVASRPLITGYLTNDSAYWKESLRPDTIDAALRIREGRSLSGEVNWAVNAGPGTTKGRAVPLRVAGDYDLTWVDYSRV